MASLSKNEGEHFITEYKEGSERNEKSIIGYYVSIKDISGITINNLHGTAFIYFAQKGCVFNPGAKHFDLQKFSMTYDFSLKLETNNKRFDEGFLIIKKKQ